MKLALGQINPTVGDLAGNVAACLEMAEQAGALGADLLVLPEMSIPGCHPKDILLDPQFVHAVYEATQDLALQAQDFCPLLVGTVLEAPKELHRPHQHPGLINAAVLLQDGVVRLAAAKRVLPAHDVFFEPRWFLPGTPPQVVQVAGAKLGVLVGIGQPWPEAQEVDAVIILAALPFYQGVWQHRLASFPTQGVVSVLVNLVGGNDDLLFDGRSMVVGQGGKLLAQLAAFERDVQVFDLDVLQEGGEPKEITLPPQEILHKALVCGIRDFAHKNGVPRAFIGLSGGVDSALVAVLAAEALGPQAVTGVALPSRYTDPRSTQAAKKLAGNLGIHFEVVSIEAMHQAAEGALADLFSTGTGGENAQARLRMIVLMSYVNRYKGMLLNTGNKTEATLGYATLYGDTAGTIAPIGDLTKPQVYALAAWLNRQEKRIPDFILSRAPTAELSPGQIDPFDYDEIAPRLEELVRTNRSNPAMRAAEHKRRQMGVVFKVSEKAFGPGRMIPLTRK